MDTLQAPSNLRIHRYLSLGDEGSSDVDIIQENDCSGKMRLLFDVVPSKG